MKLQPIVYSTIENVRFADFDAYGHVNASRYIDLVMSSRFSFAESELGLTRVEAAKLGVGFFSSEILIKYARPITSLKAVSVNSWVEEMEGPILKVPFEIKDPENDKLYSNGIITFASVDIKTGQPVPELPEKVKEIFFTSV